MEFVLLAGLRSFAQLFSLLFSLYDDICSKFPSALWPRHLQTSAVPADSRCSFIFTSQNKRSSATPGCSFNSASFFFPEFANVWCHILTQLLQNLVMFFFFLWFMAASWWPTLHPLAGVWSHLSCLSFASSWWHCHCWGFIWSDHVVFSCLDMFFHLDWS